MSDTGAPTSSAVHDADAFLRGTRRPHRRERSLSDWYIFGLAGVLILMGVISLIAFNPRPPTGCALPSCSVTVESSSAAVALGFSLVVYLAGLVLGPISVNAAEVFWVFSAPLDRRSLLRRRKGVLVMCTFIAGVVVGVIHFGFWNANPWWIATFPLAALAAMALAMLHEGRPPPIKVATVAILSVGAAAAGAGSVSSVFGAATIGSMLVPVAVAFAAISALLLIGFRAWRRPEILPLRVLRRVHAARDAVAGAVSSADSGLLVDVISAQLLVKTSFVTPFTLKGTGWSAVLDAEARRCLRSPMLLLRTLLLVAWAAITSLFGLSGVLVGISMGTMVFSSLNASALRLYATSTGLARLFPQPQVSMRVLLLLPTALLIMGLVLAFSVIAAFSPGPGLSFPTGLAVLAAAVAGLAGGVRWTTAPPTQFGIGIVMTEMGPIHVSAFMNAIRGIDVAVLLTLPVTLGLSPLWSLIIAVAGLIWLLWRR